MNKKKKRKEKSMTRPITKQDCIRRMKSATNFEEFSYWRNQLDSLVNFDRSVSLHYRLTRNQNLMEKLKREEMVDYYTLSKLSAENEIIVKNLLPATR